MGGIGQSGDSNESGMRRLTPLVGRGKLLSRAQAQVAEWLKLHYDPADLHRGDGSEQCACRNRLLVLTGPAAVGKSRFAYELVERLVDEFSVTAATAHCVENASLSTFAAEVAQVAGIRRNNLPDRWERLCNHAAQAASRAYAESARQHLPLLALLLDCEAVDTAGIRQADAESFIQGVKQALRTCCEMTAYLTGLPVVLVIEDLQWMGGLREVIADLLSHARLPQPLVALATARPEFAATTEQLDQLVGEYAHRVLKLPPLARTEGGQLIRELLPDVELPPELALELDGKAGGIPYYYEEFARFALNQGLVMRRDGKPVLAEGTADAGLPAEVKELINWRLAQLKPELRDLTGRAAVIGRSFSSEHLRKLGQGPGLAAAQELASGLAKLEQQKLIAREAGDRYVFEHALARDAAYDLVPSDDRAEMHGTMADMLVEMLVRGTAAEWDILPEAIRHLEGCGRFLEAHERICQLLVLMADMGRYDGLDTWFARALATWQPAGDGTEGAKATHGTGLLVDDPISLYPPSPGMHLAACELLRRRGECPKAQQHARAGLELVTAPNQATQRMTLLQALGRVEVDLGYYDEARACYEQALATARQLENRVTECRVLNRLGVVHHQQGRWEEMRDCFEQALRLAREIGNRRAEVSALHNLGLMHNSYGRSDSALRCFEQSLSIAQELGDRRGESILMRAYWQTKARLDGPLPEVRLALERALAISIETGNQPNEGWARLQLGCYHREFRQADVALAYYTDALAIARAFSDPLLEVRSLQDLSMLHTQGGSLDKAEQALEQATAICKSFGIRPELVRLYCLWVHHRLTVARQPAADPPCRAKALAAARRDLADAEVHFEQIGVPPDSEPGAAVSEARAALEEFEREVRAQRQAT